LVLCLTPSISAFSALPSRAFQPPSLLRAAPGSPDASYDAIIIGSGIGGLSAAAVLSSTYGMSVAVFESHSTPGGCAHGFEMRDGDGNKYSFDTGPSFFSGLRPGLAARDSSNPLSTVLEMVDEKVDTKSYETFGLLFPEGDFVHSPGTEWLAEVGAAAGENAEKVRREWGEVMGALKPLSQAVGAIPTAAIRTDPGAAVTVGRYMPRFATGIDGGPLKAASAASMLSGPFKDVIDRAGDVSDEKSTVREWLDLLCFCLSGLPARGTIAAEMAMMMDEFYDEGAVMDCPVGGAKGIVDALVRGIEKHGGKIFCNAHVDEIMVEEGRATGIRLKRGGAVVRADRAVVSNLSIWDLVSTNILDTSLLPSSFTRKAQATPPCRSFLHLHVGFEATREELDGLQAHYMFLQDRERPVDDEQNSALISIPSVHDSTVAPAGRAVLHCYTPATEPYALWEGMDQRSSVYQARKEERAQFLWEAIERVIPDIRERATVTRVGTPLTHERFLRRHRGTYGPAIVAGKQSFPFPNHVPVENLWTCGDSVFPGIGVPAVAGSGIIAANSIGDVQKHLEMLDQIMP